MVLGKILKIILTIVVILLITIGIDIYLTINTFTGLSGDEVKSMVSDPTFIIADDNSSITISVKVDIPDAGFIPKGVIITLIADFGGNQQASDTATFDVGHSKTLEISFELNDDVKAELVSGNSIITDIKAEVTPVYFGIEISRGSQKFDLQSIVVTP